MNRDGSMASLINNNLSEDMHDSIKPDEGRASNSQNDSNLNRAAIMNMSDALDAGSALDVQKQLRKYKEKMKGITSTTY